MVGSVIFRVQVWFYRKDTLNWDFKRIMSFCTKCWCIENTAAQALTIIPFLLKLLSNNKLFEKMHNRGLIDVLGPLHAVH